MKWNLPPKIKIYEALGSLGDKRLEVSRDEGKLYSSSRNKFYDIKYDSENMAIMCNDNASYFVGYLGYPAISFLMYKDIIKYDKKWEEALKDIEWKDINQKFKNDFTKTENYTLELLEVRGYSQEEFLGEVDNIYQQIKKLDLNLFGKKVKPPKGY